MSQKDEKIKEVIRMLQGILDGDTKLVESIKSSITIVRGVEEIDIEIRIKDYAVL